MGPVSGDSIIYTTTTGNTGDVTLNVDSKGAAHIRKWSGSSVLASGDLVANVPVQLIFDGTYWELQTIGNVPSGGSGTVTSVGLTMPSWLTVGSSPITTSGTIGVTPTTAQTSHQVIGTCGSATTFTPCSLVAADIPTLNQNTSGTAANLSGTPALPNGTTATTQSLADNTTKIATDAFVLANASGGIGGSATVGYEPVMVTNTTTITTSPCDHGVTTANTMTCTDSAGAKFGTTVTTTSDGVHPGASSYPGNTTLPSLPANTVSIVGPPSATLTSWSLQLPTAIPTTTDLFSCVVTGTNCLLTDTGIASANVVTLAGSQTLTNKSISLAQINSGLTSGGVVCATSTTAISMTSALTSNVFPKGGGAGICPTNSSVTDNGTTVTTTDAGGYVAPVFVANGTTAGFFDFPQGSTSAAVAPCNVANSWCVQAATAMTAGIETLDGTRGQGVQAAVGSSAALQDVNSGDANHSTTVTTSSATSVSSTSLCSTTDCPAGTYQVTAYLDVTTACSTTGTYSVSIIYTDDAASKTIVMPLQGTGATTTYGPTAITSSLALAATTNFAQGVLVVHSTGAASINYSTTATACGTGGPAAGKLYLSVFPIQ